MNKREDVIKSYARSLSTILHLCSNKIAKMEATLAHCEPGSPEAKQVEKLVTSVKLYFETGLPPMNMMYPTNGKKERRKSFTSPHEKHVKLNNMRRKGMLLIDKKTTLFSSSFKPRWVILDDRKLHIFKDEQTNTVYKELPLDAIVSISGAKMGKYEFGFHIGCADGTILNLAATDKTQMAAWMLAIDGTKHNFSFNSSMDPTEKAALIRYHSFEGRKGGHVKSNHPGGEQDWAYFKEGELGVAEGEEKNGISFKWNGEVLYANKRQQNGEPVTTCLTARWNGITLAYYFLPSNLLRIETKKPIFIPTPVVTYSWYEHDREYRPIEGSRVPIYKWTRHFLVEKSAPTGTGEWIVEGDIPEPLVMTLQLYQYHKITPPTILPTEDVHKSLTRSKSSSFSLPIPIPNHEAFAMFHRHVPPGRDKLSFNHFVTLMHEMKPGLSEPEIKLAFELVDVSKDGCVDLQEFSTWFTELKEWGND
eukprot:Phypoly_transcript_06923.p1 GENE.Phypoly_transcript_06923~~Phypoly_transcript_06923.p1  ORF type:complete len:561 (+),score=71.45 Phypoly_transcript_06923:255-1685(+)